jgi:MFS transporter, SP family, galactose:H+ symporter
MKDHIRSDKKFAAKGSGPPHLPSGTAQNSDTEHSMDAKSQHVHMFAYVITIVASFGGVLFGYDDGVITVAELFLKKDFALNATTEELAISAVLVGAILGAFVGGKLSNAFGRKKTIIGLALLFIVGAALTVFAPNVWLFMLFRLLVGCSLAIGAIVVPIYISEMVPPSMRGSLVSVNQLAVTGGAAISYWISLAFAHAQLGWRPMFGSECVPALILACGMCFLPESPRWLASRGQWKQAEHILARVVGEEKDEELKAMHKALQQGKHASLREFFHTSLWVALLVGVCLAIFQQSVGINAISYYTPTIFKYAGFKSASTDILATTVVGIDGVIASILAIFLIDRIGRRPLLIGGFIAVAVTLIGMGGVFLLGTSQAGYLILICLLVYVLAYSIGIGPVFWLLTSELFPTRLRGAGSSIATVANWSADLLISISFLSLITWLGKPLTFWLYAIFAIGAVVFSWFLVPETKGKRLEQIEEYWENGRHWE